MTGARQGEEEGELTFKAGDWVAVFKFDPDGWGKGWRCCCIRFARAIAGRIAHCMRARARHGQRCERRLSVQPYRCGPARVSFCAARQAA